MTKRKDFEAWASAEPSTMSIVRFANSGPHPEQYTDWQTQLAWEAWQEALGVGGEFA